MELRGFDDYEVTLGDEMRGERASLGKSLRDCERELRIRAELIVGIENCDLDAFPNQSVVAGYVRSYARFLGMDPEATY
ncbi:MAG: helix-turn-helix transcriptional regulator, partial [Pseudomonadota bacterium]